MPMTLGPDECTAPGGRIDAGAAGAVIPEFNIEGWPISGAGLATGTFLGTWAATSVAGRTGLGVAAWIVGTFRAGTSTDAD